MPPMALSPSGLSAGGLVVSLTGGALCDVVLINQTIIGDFIFVEIFFRQFENDGREQNERD